ncbi:MAG TPA: hypothetical protein PLY49_04465 [Opitutaceae bacterium]|nr:hypothetical protein [Opitutaceae bacterium]
MARALVAVATRAGIGPTSEKPVRARLGDLLRRIAGDAGQHLHAALAHAIGRAATHATHHQQRYPSGGDFLRPTARRGRLGAQQ